MKQFSITLFSEPAVHIACDTLVVPIPRDERPLRGEAGWVDWRICGALSEQLASGFVTGLRGEAVLLPAPRPLPAARLLLVGIGNTERLEGRILQRGFAQVAEKLISLRAPAATIAFPGAVDLAYDAEFLVQGCLAAFSSASDAARLSLMVGDAEKCARPLATAMENTFGGARQRKVELDIRWPEMEAAETRSAAQ